MSTNRYIAFITVLLTWGIINYYIGLRAWQAFEIFLSPYSLLFWIIFILLAFSYIAGRIGEKLFPGLITSTFLIIGSYWLGVIFYTFLLLLAFELLRLVIPYLHYIPFRFDQEPYFYGVIFITILIILIVYGTLNARNPIFRQYDVTIAKKTNKIKKLHIIMISDLHLGNIVNNTRLVALVNKINKRRPDLVLIVGDIIEEDVKPFKKQGMSKTLAKLKAKFGCYAVLGNHDYYGGQYRKVIESLQSANINVLRDNYILIKESFYLLGRDDRFSRNRKDLNSIMQNLDEELPVILMDHNPLDLSEANNNGVDLQLSGHTHKGQFWPINKITNLIFENHWGYLRKDNLQVIVTNGFGTWGPPLRIGNKPEVVEIFVEISGD